MEHAALAVRDCAWRLGGERDKIVIVAGRGNNGGDALAVARLLANYKPDVLLTTPASATPLHQKQLQAVQQLKIKTEVYRAGLFHAKYANTHLLIIDGICGLGMRGEFTPVMQQLVHEINSFPHKKVLAIDLPSGLVTDSGHLPQHAISADMTVTFGNKKPAHVFAPTRDLCGEIVETEIGFPPATVQAVVASKQPLMYGVKLPILLVETSPYTQTTLKASAHKYQRGHVLIIGGSAGKYGAPLLAGLAAMRSGAGWVSVATPKQTQMSMPLDLTYEDFFQTGKINLKALQAFVKHRKVRAIIIGCGCLQSPITTELWDYLVQFAANDACVIVDAGALQDTLSFQQQGHANIILTPHAGEWKTLSTPAPVTPNCLDSVRAVHNLATEHNLTLVYKNACPLVFAPQTTAVYACDFGNNSLAKAGSGDIFCGILAGSALAKLTTDPTSFASTHAVLTAYAKLVATANKAISYVGKQALTPTLLLENITSD